MANGDNLSVCEVKVLLRLGHLLAEGRGSKHSHGYRYYELAERNISEAEILDAHLSLSNRGIATWSEKLKYWSDGRQERVALMNLSKRGMTTYFEAQSATRVGLRPTDLEWLDKLLSDSQVDLQDFSAAVLLSYVDFIEISNKTGYNISDFAKRVLSEEDGDRALLMLEGLREAAEKVPRHSMTNSEVDLLFSVVRQVEEEVKRPRIRINMLKAKLLVILAVAASVAAIVSAVIDFLKVLG